MEAVLALLGFTTTAGIVWNSIAYAAAVGSIAGLFIKERNKHIRYTLFTVCGVALAAYSHLFLHSLLFSTLQVVVTCSALFQLCKFEPWRARVSLTLLTGIALIILILSGNLNDVWGVIGTVGLVGIAVGLVLFPLTVAYLLLAAGALFLVGYALETAAWVFFALNIVFALSSIIQWYLLYKEGKSYVA
ncbi:MAG: hypothetical protein HYT93_03805 [Parcubacteria group bacterium]|nr:hypothetical protein [Parcubacteria group bacterium]